MAGKGAPPLFDLIRSDVKVAPSARPGHAPERAPEPAPEAPQATQQAAPPPQAAPAPEPKPKPKRKLAFTPARRPEPSPEPEEPSPAASEPPPPPPTDSSGTSENDGEAGGPQIDFKKKFSVPVAALYISVPLILLGVLIAYSWGFSAGGKNRDNELKPYLQPGEVVDPLVAGAESRQAQPTGSSSPERQAERAGGSGQQASQQRPQRPAASPVTRDTREVGMNYLLIARADGERAIKAAMALTERGLPTIAVESGPGRSNNAWRLYSLLGISSEKFKEEWQLRADHKAKIVAACRDLDADAGGPIDASTAYWEKYAP